LKSVTDDYFKFTHLNEHNLNDRLTILRTFSDQALLISIIKEKQYHPYINEFLSIITDQKFIFELFNKCCCLKYCLEIINCICDEKLKRSLIELLQDDFYKTALISNYDDEHDELISNQDISNIKLDLDPSITFGIELETCNDDYNTVLKLTNILRDWQVMWDVSLKNGVEFVSPVLRFCREDLQALKFICDLLEDNYFYIDDSCGGHIHLGFDYFKTIDEFNVFLNLYGNVEDILYLISNRTGSRIRGRVLRYANKLKPILEKIPNLTINFDKCCDLGAYATLIKKQIKERYYGLNLKNINSSNKNTIEFRMPNGEINFLEIVLNIRLFVKMLERSKTISNILVGTAKTKQEIKWIELYNKLVSIELDERSKVSYLLNILFDSIEERNLYYKRYVNNISLNPGSIGNNRKVLCLKK